MAAARKKLSKTPKGILTGPAILNAIRKGSIEIEDFNPRHLNPASYDLTLGGEVRVYRNVVAVMGPSDGPNHGAGAEGEYLYPTKDHVLDSKVELPTHRFEIPKDGGWILKPGIGYLMHTRERIMSSKYVPIIDGKSTIGRLFIAIHETAGYGDIGFNGQYTLEVRVTHPVRVYEGMRFCQMRFHTVRGRIVKYGYEAGSHYLHESAKGAVASKSFTMFGDRRLRFVDECREVALKLGKDDRGTHARVSIGIKGDVRVYEDDKVYITAAKFPLFGMEVRAKSNNNPVICVDEDGRVYRSHGESGYLFEHISELASSTTAASSNRL